MKTYNDLLTELRTRLRDTADTRWTSSEKGECLTAAYRDPSIVSFDVDTSLTASTATQSYTVPTSAEKIMDIAIADSSGVLYREPSTSWEQKYGKIIFYNYPSRNGTFNLNIIKKLTTSDSVKEEFAELILAIAGLKAFEMLLNKFASGFLINDLSMAELQAGLAYYERKVKEARNQAARVSNRNGYKI